MVKQFFKKYPKAPYVLVVGDKLFLAGFESQADKYAATQNLTSVRHDNPKLTAPSEEKTVKDA